MHKTIQSLLDAALKLSVSDRIEITHRLLDSLPDEYGDCHDTGIDAADFRQEMELRAQDSVTGVPWKEIYAEG